VLWLFWQRSRVPELGFLRYVVSYLSHLDNGGRVDDHVTGKVIGNKTGVPFDFERLKGGPLFRVRGSLPVKHLFIGHAVCPGFRSLCCAY
jgi:hypothetical protein